MDQTVENNEGKETITLLSSRERCNMSIDALLSWAKKHEGWSWCDDIEAAETLLHWALRGDLELAAVAWAEFGPAPVERDNFSPEPSFAERMIDFLVQIPIEREERVMKAAETLGTQISDELAEQLGIRKDEEGPARNLDVYRRIAELAEQWKEARTIVERACEQLAAPRRPEE